MWLVTKQKAKCLKMSLWLISFNGIEAREEKKQNTYCGVKKASAEASMASCL